MRATYTDLSGLSSGTNLLSSTSQMFPGEADMSNLSSAPGMGPNVCISTLPQSMPLDSSLAAANASLLSDHSSSANSGSCNGLIL